MTQRRIVSLDADSSSTPQPACPTTARGIQEWRAIEYTDRLSAFYDPCTCAECFPQGVVEQRALDQVVLSRHHGSSFHRLADQESADESVSAVASDGGTRTDPFAECERVPVRSITDLHPGDGVVWDGVVEPLVVQASTPAPPSAVVPLQGPDGGDYYLELRSGMADVVFPGYGQVSGLRRMSHQEAATAQPPSAGE